MDEIGDTYVLIQIGKNFRRPLTPNVIRFEQRLDDGLTLGTIDITDEVIYNNTGVDWTGYHWEISECVAAFNRTATDSSGFDVSPFTNKTWGPQQCGNWQSDHVASLTVDGGTVHAGGTFTPGLDQGKLSIDVDLSGTGPVQFTLTQFPIPEPAALTTVTIGFLGVLLRRRRRP